MHIRTFRGNDGPATMCPIQLSRRYDRRPSTGVAERGEAGSPLTVIHQRVRGSARLTTLFRRDEELQLLDPSSRADTMARCAHHRRDTQARRRSGLFRVSPRLFPRSANRPVNVIARINRRGPMQPSGATYAASLHGGLRPENGACGGRGPRIHPGRGRWRGHHHTTRDHRADRARLRRHRSSPRVNASIHGPESVECVAGGRRVLPST